MGPKTIAQILQLAGISSINGLGNQPNRFFNMVLSGTNVAAGATFQDVEAVEKGSTFVATSIVGRAWCTALNGAAIAGSEFSRNGDSLIANNTMPPYNLVTLGFNTDSQPLALTDIWPNLVGTIESPHIPDFPWIIGGGAVVKVSGLNGTAVPMSWSITLQGAYIRV